MKKAEFNQIADYQDEINGLKKHLIRIGSGKYLDHIIHIPGNSIGLHDRFIPVSSEEFIAGYKKNVRRRIHALRQRIYAIMNK